MQNLLILFIMTGFVFPAPNETTRQMNEVFRLSSAPTVTEMVSSSNQTGPNRRRRSTPLCSEAEAKSCTFTVVSTHT